MPRVSITDTSQAIDINDGEILYDALSDRGVQLPHGCLSGSCGACRVEIVAGKENLHKAGVIESDTIKSLREEFATTKGAGFAQEAEIRLSCRAKVTGDISIKLIK